MKIILKQTKDINDFWEFMSHEDKELIGINDFSYTTITNSLWAAFYDIIIKENDNLTYVGFFRIDFNLSNRTASVSVGYVLPKHRKKKVYYHAKKELLRILFEIRSIYRIKCSNFCLNTSIRKVNKYLDFIKEGESKKSDYYKGEWVDREYYSILREDYFKIKKQKQNDNQ